MSALRPIDAQSNMQYDPTAFLPTKEEEKKAAAVAIKEIQHTAASKMAPAPKALNANRVTITPPSLISQTANDDDLLMLWSSIRSGLRDAKYKDPYSPEACNARFSEKDFPYKFSSGEELRVFLQRPEIIPLLSQIDCIACVHHNIETIPVEISLFSNLKVLILDNNQIQEIPQNLLPSFLRLQLLSLRNNKIKSCPEGLIGKIPSLDLTGNPILRH